MNIHHVAGFRLFFSGVVLTGACLVFMPDRVHAQIAARSTATVVTKTADQLLVESVADELVEIVPEVTTVTTTVTPGPTALTPVPTDLTPIPNVGWCPGIGIIDAGPMLLGAVPDGLDMFRYCKDLFRGHGDMRNMRWIKQSTSSGTPQARIEEAIRSTPILNVISGYNTYGSPWGMCEVAYKCTFDKLTLGTPAIHQTNGNCSSVTYPGSTAVYKCEPGGTTTPWLSGTPNRMTTMEVKSDFSIHTCPDGVTVHAWQLLANLVDRYDRRREESCW